MPGRRQKVSDEDVFVAAQRVMSRRGPHELTLSDIAAEAGVTAGRLVQRFGSKRALLVALSERFAASAGPVFAGLRAAHGSPLATLRAYAACMADLAPTPAALLRNLAYLQVDLGDEALRAHLVENARATRREIARLLEAAIGAGEIRRDVDVRALARTVETIVGGSLMSWATYREGQAVDWIVRDLDAVLAPWLKRRPAKGAASHVNAVAGTAGRGKCFVGSRPSGMRTTDPAPEMPAAVPRSTALPQEPRRRRSIGLRKRE
jgi:AcrR family transcriptional regulator